MELCSSGHSWNCVWCFELYAVIHGSEEHSSRWPAYAGELATEWVRGWWSWTCRRREKERARRKWEGRVEGDGREGREEEDIVERGGNLKWISEEMIMVANMENRAMCKRCKQARVTGALRGSALGEVRYSTWNKTLTDWWDQAGKVEGDVRWE